MTDMTRQLSHRDCVILPVGGLFYAPACMGPEEATTIRRVREALDLMVEQGPPPMMPESVTWDAAIRRGSAGSKVVYVGDPASAIGADVGTAVRVTLSRRDERYRRKTGVFCQLNQYLKGGGFPDPPVLRPHLQILPAHATTAGGVGQRRGAPACGSTVVIAPPRNFITCSEHD